MRENQNEDTEPYLSLGSSNRDAHLNCGADGCNSRAANRKGPIRETDQVVMNRGLHDLIATDVRAL